MGLNSEDVKSMSKSGEIESQCSKECNSLYKNRGWVSGEMQCGEVVKEETVATNEMGHGKGHLRK